jgi:hypothetical protein
VHRLSVAESKTRSAACRNYSPAQEDETMSGWPDPEKPGVPLNPERDGWHWIVGWSDKLFVAEWDSDQQDYVWFDGGDDPSGMVENGWTYAGLVHTHAEVDALLAENARLRAVLIDLLDDAWVRDFGEWFEDRLKQARAALEWKP